MASVQDRIQNVVWEEYALSAYSLEIDSHTRALSKYSHSEFQRELVVFGVPGWQLGTADLPLEACSITEWSALPPSMQTLNRQGRGVGLRFYTTPAGLKGTQEVYEKAGVYALTVDSRKIVYRTGQSIRRIRAERMLLQVQALLGDERAVTTVHDRLGEIDLAVYDQPPAGRQLQRERGVPWDTDDRLLIVRNPKVTARRLGYIPLERLFSH